MVIVKKLSKLIIFTPPYSDDYEHDRNTYVNSKTIPQIK